MSAAGYFSRSSLVRIRAGDQRRPLFCFHPLGGTVLRYYTLAAALGSECPVFGLQSVGLNPDLTPHASIEEMVKHYLKEIRMVQPRGPYHLIGYSMGGLLAFETARQLHDQGEVVGLLGMIDASPGVDLQEGTYYACHVLERIGLPVSLAPGELLDLDPADRTDMLIQSALKGNAPPEGYTERRLRRMVALYEYNGHAATQYQLRKLNQRIALYRAAGRHNGAPSEESDYGWSAFVSKVSLYDVPGDHFEMLEPAYVDTLASHVRGSLPRVEERVVR